MIDLKTCTRQEMQIAWDEREGYIKHLESENHNLNLRLQEYEGIQTDDDKEVEFEKFFNDYGYKKNKKQTKKLYLKLSKKKKKKIKKHLPLYKLETPNGLYRVTPDKYLRNEKFNDAVEAAKEFNRPVSGAKALNPMKEKLAEMEAIRVSRTVDVSAIIKQLK